MARFVLIADEATALRISVTGCDALHITVTGQGPGDAVVLMSHDMQAGGSPAMNLSYSFPARELTRFQRLHIDPVLYGREGHSYRLEVGLRSASDQDWRLLETMTGVLVRARVSTMRAASGTDAPLLIVDLERPVVFGEGPPPTAAAEPPAAPIEPMDGDDFDLSRDFPLGASEEAGHHRVTEPSARYVAATTDGARLYPVWYGTNRLPEVVNGKLVGYSARRDNDNVHYGLCTVRIPRSHKIGDTGSPFWKRLLTFTDDRLTLSEILTLERAVFWSDVAKQLRAAEPGARHIVVFLHGYNVSFEEAAIRAAQLGCDLSIEGAMAFYSWPSRGSVEGYFADESTVQASAIHVTRFLEEISELAEAEKVHVIAHSMGNRAALEAVREIVARAEARARIPFSQFILAAPDVDAEYFLQFAAAYQRVASRTTMYVSDHDQAVRASRFLHGGDPRVGLAPPLQIVAGIDTVYAGEVDQSLLGHGYVASTWQLLNDIHQMIHLDAEPKKRAWVKRAASNDHWRLKDVS